MLARTFALFIVTACAEIVGCWLPMQWLVHRRTPLLLVPAAASLVAFVWLLSLHPAAAGRTYAAYGGVYVVVALVWLRVVEHQAWRTTDLVGALLILAGVAVISARA